MLLQDYRAAISALRRERDILHDTYKDLTQHAVRRASAAVERDRIDRAVAEFESARVDSQSRHHKTLVIVSTSSSSTTAE